MVDFLKRRNKKPGGGVPPGINLPGRNPPPEGIK